MKTFDERLAAYFAENELAEDMQQAIRRCLGAPDSNYDAIMADADKEHVRTVYDANFESILDTYAMLFHSAELFQSLCGWYGTVTLYVTAELEGIAVEQL